MPFVEEYYTKSAKMASRAVKIRLRVALAQNLAEFLLPGKLRLFSYLLPTSEDLLVKWRAVS